MSTAVGTAATAEILEKLDWILEKFGIIFSHRMVFQDLASEHSASVSFETTERKLSNNDDNCLFFLEVIYALA
jgi:hypothetical protein